MNNRTATLGIGAAVIGVLTALVGAALAGKAQPKGSGSPGGDRAGGTGGAPVVDDGVSVQPLAPDAGADLLPPAAAPGPASPTDGPSGPTAPERGAPTGQEGHAVPDLAADAPLGPDHRAPEAFRPDMDAPMTAAEREALRPATGPSPSLVSDEGASVQGPGGNLL